MNTIVISCATYVPSLCTHKIGFFLGKEQSGFLLDMTLEDNFLRLKSMVENFIHCYFIKIDQDLS